MKQDFERVPVYRESPGSQFVDPNSDQYRLRSRNTNFSPTFLTWFNFAILIVLYPLMALVGVDENTPQLLANLSQEMIIFMLLVTILVQWTIFLFNYVGAYTEGTGLAGIGFRPMEQVAHMSRLGRTAVYFGIALAFLLAANLILAGIAWFLGQIGLPLPGEIGMIVPTDPVGRVVWIAVSFTAGFCEETAFRGYLMSRLRLVSGLKGWAMPIIVSSVAFGVCHAYQGWPGFIVITIYGAMFAWLYIRTGSIWPAIIAHSLQDLGALIWPH